VLRSGRIDWSDATTAPKAAVSLTDVSLDAKALAWPLEAPMVFQGEGVLADEKGHGKLVFSGQGNASGAAVKVGVDSLPLGLALPYLNAMLVPPLAGDVDAELAIEWQAAAAGPRIKVEARRFSVAGLSVGDAKSPEVAAERVELADARLDNGERSASIGRLALTAPRLRADRDRDGRWNFERWLLQPASAAGSAAAPAASAASASSPAGGTGAPWKLALGELAIVKGRFGFSDLLHATPVAVEVSQIAVQLRGWATESPAAAPAAPFRVVARVGVPAGASGKAVGSGVVGGVEVRGEMKAFSAGVPGRAKATIALKDLPLHLLDPYLEDRYRIEVQKAQTSFRGDVAWERRPAGPELRLRGDATIDDFRAASQAPAAAAGPASAVPGRDAAPDPPPGHHPLGRPGTAAGPTRAPPGRLRHHRRLGRAHLALAR